MSSIKWIEDWKSHNNVVKDFLQKCANEIDTIYGSASEVSPGVWIFITGGWSENESIINAMWSNFYLRATTIQATFSGGMHVFASTDTGRVVFEQATQAFKKALCAPQTSP